jgi:2-polyprenyl-6-methoxyphenol hydroxylase-like FAD-dependent oxidoreductase
MIRLGSDALWWSIGSEEPEIQKLIEVQAKGYGMKLKELESLLRNAAIRVGADIINRTIVDGNELLTMHPDAKAIIGADGRHSTVRETLIRPSDHAHPDTTTDARDDEFIDARTMQHTVYINLDLQGDITQFNLEGGTLQNLAFSAADSILHAGAHPVRLVVGRPQACGRVPLTAIFFIDAATASSVRTCARRGPAGPGRLVGDPRVPPALAQDVARFLRERFGDGAADPRAAELVYVAIDRYCARAAAADRGRAGVYLVGDACFGVPYFRALSNGLKCGSTLAQYLAMPGVGAGAAGAAATVRAYRGYVRRLYQQALSAAEATALGSAALGCAIAVGQALAAGATAAQEEEGRALAALGYANHEEGDPPADADEGGGGGGGGGWGARLLQPLTGREEYEFGDVTRAALRGGRAAVGAAARGGVGAAAAALHGFVGLTGVRL